MRITRRQLLKTGVAGSLLLACSGWLNSAGVRAFTAAEREMLAAIADAMLDGVLPRNREQRALLLATTVDGVGRVVNALSAATQREISELFGLLVLAPGRWVLAGVSTSWRNASREEVRDFLETWRFSRIALLQSAYAALHDLCYGAWYAQPASWEAIGYPGPPRGYF